MEQRLSNVIASQFSAMQHGLQTCMQCTMGAAMAAMQTDLAATLQHQLAPTIQRVTDPEREFRT
eukprot:5762330-Pyramimonas_sp.AAC.1